MFRYTKISVQPCVGFYLRTWQHTRSFAGVRTGMESFVFYISMPKAHYPTFKITACHLISMVPSAAEAFTLGLYREFGGRGVVDIWLVFIFGQMIIRLWIWTPVPVQWQNQCNLLSLDSMIFLSCKFNQKFAFVISSPHNQNSRTCQQIHHFLVSWIQCFLILLNLVLHACFCININKWF